MRVGFTNISFLLSSKLSARRRRALTASLIVCLLLAGCNRQPRYAKDESPPETKTTTQSQTQMPRTNLPMPPVTSAHGAQAPIGGWTLLDGRRQTLADYRGKVLVLDLYATYCPPCRDEIPHLNALRSRFRDQGLEVVGLNVGGPDDRREVPGFVADLGITYDLGNPDDAFVDAISGGDSRIPRTYVFDRQGRLVDFSVGYDEAVAAQLDDAVQKALASEAVTSDK
jgi:thiol-disulfide isomerase/thioredoxin